MSVPSTELEILESTLESSMHKLALHTQTARYIHPTYRLTRITTGRYKFSFPFQLHEEDDALNMWMYDAVENNGKYTR